MTSILELSQSSMDTVLTLQAKSTRPWESVWNNVCRPSLDRSRSRYRYGLPAYTNTAFAIFNILFLLAILVVVVILRPEDTLIRVSFSMSFLSGVIQLVDCYRARRKHYATLGQPLGATLDSGEKATRLDAREQFWSEEMSRTSEIRHKACS